MDHDHTALGIENQIHRSVVWVRVSKDDNAVSLPRSLVESSFSSIDVVGKGKVCRAVPYPMRSVDRVAHLPVLGREPVGG